ncbi:MAG: 1-deoxy-D-xylulose-5-phosphate synthase [Flavobacteriaceae bacterium]|nr:1-deoxy-D-xylulose-5-phosphate synthase [Flavobacteriaceae bacterium]
MKTFKELPTVKPSTPLLDSLVDLKNLSNFNNKELIQLTDELREYLLYSTNISGGHFGAGLGVIELTVALHHVFNPPEDKIIWDVGHQAYPHKILTGRKEAMPTIRKKNGLHPFPHREESKFDAFGAGHSSTSISAALGMALGGSKDNKYVSIIGDGAITAGMAYEALAHAGAVDKDLLVILNDNNMSISNNTGGISNYLAKIWSSRFYIQVRESGKTVLRMIPSAKRFAKRTESHIKGMLSPGTLFEELGFQYIGPMDGHDIKSLVRTLNNLKDLSGPIFLHLVTKKGKGFIPAELDPIKYHAISGQTSTSTSKNLGPKYQDVFGEWLCEKARKGDQDLVAITPAMSEGSGMVNFSKEFPEQFYDVAIAEQHSMTLAAGIACEGKKPVLAIYSTFLQRAYDQLIHDVALQNLDVLLAIDRAGLVGEDGSTHAGIFDLTYLRCIPNMVVMAPANEDECWKMLELGYEHKGPAAVRYPRGNGPGADIIKDAEKIEIGKARLIKEENSKIAILSFGSVLDIASEVSEKLKTSLFDMRFVKPLDEKALIEISKKYDLLVTIEENVIAGGAGSAVNEFVHSNSLNVDLLNVGIPDSFPIIGSPNDQKDSYGLNAESIIKRIKTKID